MKRKKDKGWRKSQKDHIEKHKSGFGLNASRILGCHVFSLGLRSYKLIEKREGSEGPDESTRPGPGRPPFTCSIAKAVASLCRL